MQHITEFKAGDLVTFKPYETATPARVLAVQPSRPQDTRVFYELTGAGMASLTTFTTGGSIIESKYYTPHTTENWSK